MFGESRAGMEAGWSRFPGFCFAKTKSLKMTWMSFLSSAMG
jgi:hypothetical protein